MFSRAALAVFVTVVAEILLFGYVAQAIGAFVVVLLVFGAALAGMALLRSQFGGHAGRPASDGTDGDRTTRDLADRGVLVVAALLLILPGLLTSAVGVLLVLPPVRVLVGAKARDRISKLVPQSLGDLSGFAGFPGFPGGASPFGTGPSDSRRTGPRRTGSRRTVVDIDIVDQDRTNTPANNATQSTQQDTVKEDTTGSAPPELS